VIGLALLGAGTIGAIHATNIGSSRDAKLLWTIDTDIARARTLAEMHGGKATSSIAEALADPAVDAVIIASSTGAHEEHILAVTGAGKAMLCEKPLADGLERAQNCVRAVEASAIVAGMGFNRRLDAQYQRLLTSIRDGVIGAVEMIHVVSRSEGPANPAASWASGGMFRDKGSHFFDLAAWLCDSDPVEIFTMGACLIDSGYAKNGDVDTASVSLRFASGALASFDFGRRTTYGYEESISVHGANGLIEAGRQPAGGVTLFQGESAIADGLHRGWHDRFAPTYGEELRRFIEAVQGHGVVHAGPRDGLRAQAVAEAAVTSARENRPVSIERVW
jgi:myo-inositol 2-dehydrogenase / D-chiro-inositol 1-dehydrogenase